MTHCQGTVLYVRLHAGGPRPLSAERYDNALGLLRGITPVVEPLPPDAALLDVRGSLRYFDRDAAQLAELIRVRTLAQQGLDCTVGVAANPMLARLVAQFGPDSEPPPGPGVGPGLGPGPNSASGFRPGIGFGPGFGPGPDSAPDSAPGSAPGFGSIRTLGDPRAVAAFLAPLPVLALPGVGTATARTLGSYGLHTVGLLAATPLPTLQRILGAGPGRQLHQRAQGTDPTPVATGVPTRSFAAEHTFDRDELDPVEHRQVLLALTHHLGARLRTGNQATGALTLTVRYADRSATTRSRSLAEPTAHTPALTTTAYQLYEALALQRARVRALTLRAEGVRPAAHATRQLSLDPADDRAHRLEAVIDRSTTRYGTVVLTRAALCRIA